jgi:NAD+ kinase
MRTLIFGTEDGPLREEVRRHPALELVDSDPEVVVCFGGDGTLLSAELRWPGVPKVPIRNSRRGIRCIPHEPAEVIERLAGDALHKTLFMKLECDVRYQGQPLCSLCAMNEFNVHMGLINSAVRFRLWIDDLPHQDGHELLGDGFVVSTPFGSTAYYNQITHGVFRTGIGIAFKATAEHTGHMVVSDDSEVRFTISRGPAVLAFDNAPDYFDLSEGDEAVIRRNAQPAAILTVDPIRHPLDTF